MASPYPIVLSHFQVEPVLGARQEGRTSARTSPDLGLTEVEVGLDAEGIMFPSGDRVPWAALEHIWSSRATGRLADHCYVLEAGEMREIQAFSRRTNRFHSLLPTYGAPTLVIAGFPMHRIKDTDPHEDTLAKLRAAGPLRGRVLD
ncbi:MAG: spermine synthase, partial [Chloroflexota bacterium]|nr:spermine synthase [Chloroflexota bacterium]